ncbi:actin-57B-like [Antedon mediterranea]|uniref:actin-57B-like n=1 Tax=Antedon mediterranea TaxID=105859 RepID=UPI003AF6ECC8
MSGDNAAVVVIDNGSIMCKAGFAGEDAPRVMFPAIVGRPKHQLLEQKEYYVGDEAYSQLDNLDIEYPIERGVITNWDAMEKIWHHCFYNELKIKPEEHLVLVLEPVMNPTSNREGIMKVLFEKFNVPAMYLSIQGQMSIYASGRGSAISVDIGDGVIHIVPIYEGFAIMKAIQRIEFGGCDLTQYMAQLLAERGYTFMNTAEMESVRKLKDSLCYVAEDFQQELASASSNPSLAKSYQLADGREITLGEERFRCPEVLFDPSLMELDHCGIHQIVYNSIMKCDIDTRGDIYCSIVISGGTSLIPGFAERLQKEIKSLAPKSMRVRVVAAQERKFNVWIGGSILGSLSTFQKMWITRKEYDELGNRAIKKLVL